MARRPGQPSQPPCRDGVARHDEPNPRDRQARHDEPNPRDRQARHDQPNPRDRQARHDQPNPRDRGSVSVFFVVAAIAMLVLIGLVVDGGGKIRALQKADAAAAEAARQGGQAIVAAPAVEGEGVQVDAAAARAAAQAYLDQSGVEGSASIVNGTQLTVTTTKTYRPIFLSLVGVDSIAVTGGATVRLARGPNGG